MNNLKKLIEITDKVLYLIKSDMFFEDKTGESILETIEGIKQKLVNKKYSVCVIAAMKAGKSTVFNAVLGEDILPNETNACTVAITEIKHSSKNSNKIDKFYTDGTKREIRSINRQTLQEKFLEDIRNSRKNNEVERIEKYYIEHEYEALKEKKYEGIVEKFLLIDTPGPNEASNGVFDTKKLKETAYYQLRNADAIIFVLDYQVYKSDTNAKLLTDIFEGRSDLKKDIEKIYFVVNKIDARTSKDGSIEEILNNVRAMIIHQTGGVIQKPNIIAISALKAMYGRTIINHNISDKNKEDCRKKYSAEYEKKVIIEGQEYRKTIKDEELAKKLIEDSNIKEFEDKAIINTFLKASNKMILGNKDVLLDKINLIKSQIQTDVDIQNKSIDDLQQGINKSKKEIENLINTSEVMFDKVREKNNLIDKEIGEKIQSMENDLDEVLNNVFIKYDDHYESTDRAYLNNLVRSLEQECKNSIENFVLRKQDEFMRIYNNKRREITGDIYKIMGELSKNADKIIKSNLNIDIKTSSMISNNYENYININSNTNIKDISTTIGDVSQDDYIDSGIKAGTKTAIGAATIGYAIAGIPGAIVGGLAGAIGGFIVGSSDKKSSQEVYTIPKYTLDLGKNKQDILNKFNQQGKILKSEFEKFIEEEKDLVEEEINKVLYDLQHQINVYLEDLIEKFEKEKHNKEEYKLNLIDLKNKFIKCEKELEEI